ncbi:MAG: hypothetical protein ACPLRZ_01635 [Thermovenabulum sp.]|uniref:hypothetical protein n=1 Tax=Thermovenabulum sp. TaxID=3100335 RepID=UPI003C7C54C1
MDNDFFYTQIKDMALVIEKYIKKEWELDRKDISFASHLLSGAFFYILLKKMESGEVPTEEEIRNLTGLWLNGIKPLYR